MNVRIGHDRHAVFCKMVVIEPPTSGHVIMYLKTAARAGRRLVPLHSTDTNSIRLKAMSSDTYRLFLVALSLEKLALLMLFLSSTGLYVHILIGRMESPKRDLVVKRSPTGCGCCSCLTVFLLLSIRHVKPGAFLHRAMDRKLCTVASAGVRAQGLRRCFN